MQRQDLTQHSNEKLSLIVFNEDFFYMNRHKKGFIDTLNFYYIYSYEQLEQLKTNLEEDKREINEC